MVTKETTRGNESPALRADKEAAGELVEQEDLTPAVNKKEADP